MRSYLASIVFITVNYFSISASAFRGSLCIPGCPVCDSEKIAECGPLDMCDEYIKEPGCGCCFTCALKEGEWCGLYTRQCGYEMKCLGKNNSISLLELISGKGKCTRLSDASSEESTETQTTTTTTNSRRRSKRMTSQYRKALSRARRNLHGILHHIKGSCLRQRYSSCQETQREFNWIPTCDRHGFYAPMQCETSMGRIQGKCWCVDRNGIPLEDTLYVRGDPGCSETTT